MLHEFDGNISLWPSIQNPFTKILILVLTYITIEVPKNYANFPDYASEVHVTVSPFLGVCLYVCSMFCVMWIIFSFRHLTE